MADTKRANQELNKKLDKLAKQCLPKPVKKLSKKQQLKKDLLNAIPKPIAVNNLIVSTKYDEEYKTRSLGYNKAVREARERITRVLEVY